MNPFRQASIDLGSNSVLLTIVEGQRVLHDEARVVGLGKGLGDGGAFDPERMEAALQALTDYAKTAEAMGVTPRNVLAVATSASRRATNADAFYARVRQKTGLQFRIITGEEEAVLGFRGALWGRPLHGDTVVATIDLGGGSTEVVLGNREGLLWSKSLELGSARLTEDFLGTEIPSPGAIEKARAYVRTSCEQIPASPRPNRTLALAGTATTLGAIDAGLQAWNPEVIQGRPLSRTTLQELAQRLAHATPADRQRISAISPQRADFLLAGCLVLDEVTAALGGEQCELSVQGLRYGVF